MASQALQTMSKFIPVAHKSWQDLVHAHLLHLYLPFPGFSPSSYPGSLSVSQIYHIPFCFGSFTHAFFPLINAFSILFP